MDETFVFHRGARVTVVVGSNNLDATANLGQRKKDKNINSS